MTSFNDHTSKDIIKALVMGDSGTGKTGMLASLANPGYKLLIHDLDNGLDILGEYLTPEGRERVFFHTYDLGSQKDAAEFGRRIKKWGEDDIPETKDLDASYVIVVDTLGSLAELIRVFTLRSKGIDPKTVAFSREYWGEMQRVMLEPLVYLTGPLVPCNVIINTHIQEIENSSGILKGYPKTVGKALSRDIGKLFNNVWGTDKKRDGTIVLKTQGDNYLPLKTSTPSRVKSEEALDLGTIFNHILKGN